ncbi:MAG: PKD domain-containing protein [Thermoplasmata archaeon]|nr:PKD domain-containing protein [Thermoplasmata archaeon]
MSFGQQTTLAPHPSATPLCQDATTDDDAYNPILGTASGGSAVVNLFPFWPNPYQQSPCAVTAQDPMIGGTYNDEAHITFSSPADGSGSHWTVPLRLPNPSLLSQVSFLNDFYVGQVVSGDTNSTYNESYFQVIFSPATATNGSVVYDVTLSVFSLYTSSTGAAATGSCASAATGLGFTWNNNYACEQEVLGAGKGLALTGPLPAGQKLNVTISGTPRSTSAGLTVYVNDSSQPKYSKSYTLTKSSGTGGITFSPAYSSSCTDVCYLNWSMPFGNGFGSDINYNTELISNQQEVNPVWIGSPEYLTASGYTGDFTYITFESASGGCSGQSHTLPCGNLPGGYAWPYYQFNGTVLNFGSSNNYNWTTQDFGGAFYEWSGLGTPNDVVPLWLDTERNNTPVGYIASGGIVTVSVRAQALGAVSAVNVSFTLPDGSGGTIPMIRSSGNSSTGIYVASLPSTGGDGTITYKLTATDRAGQVLKLPALGSDRVTRGPIPRFTVTFQMLPNPPGCGTINFNGIGYGIHNTVTLPAAQYTAVAHPCYPYVFQRWSAFGIKLNATTTHSLTTIVNLTGNATLQGIWLYIRPHDTVTFQIATNNCGAILFNRTTIAVNTTVHPLDGLSYPLSFSNCALNYFSGWVIAIPENLTVLGGVPATILTLHGNGTIVLTFLPQTPQTIPIVFDTIPRTCGGILFRGAGYVNATTVDVHVGTSYPINADPCGNWGLINFTATPGITLASATLTASAPGTVTVRYFAETIATFETYPSGCGYVVFDGTSYYDNQTLIVGIGSTHTAFGVPCAGYSFTGFHCTGGMFCTGNAVYAASSGIVQAVFNPGVFKNFVAFITSPANCGTIEFNGQNYTGGGFTRVLPNATVPIHAWPCTSPVPSGFVGWSTGGAGIAINNPSSNANTAWVNGSGSITANFQPLEPLSISTIPSTCGSVIIAGVGYTSGQTANIAAPNSYPISAAPCAHYTFGFWVSSTGAAVANGTLYLYSRALLTAIFRPAVYQVVLDVYPRTCGGAQLTYAGTTNVYTNNTTLALSFGNYPVGISPCSGFHLDHWVVTGNVTVLSAFSDTTTLVVNGSGSLTGVYFPAKPVVSLAAPSSVYTGFTVSLSVHIGTLVAPYTYSYDWSYGDGAKETTTYNFTTHNYPVAGQYVVRVTIHDPYHREANATATISVVAQSAGAASGIGLTG